MKASWGRSITTIRRASTLGLFQHDVNVLWDLAPHDLSVMDYLIGLEPDLVVATGSAHVNCLEDVAHLTVYFPITYWPTST